MSFNITNNKTKHYISLALYILMQKKEYEELSVKEICEKANVSRMSFYRYYSKKDDIFIDFTDERFEEFYNSIQKIKDLDSYKFVLEMFRYFKKYTRQIRILIKAKKEHLLLAQFNNYATYITRNVKTHRFDELKNNPLYPYYVAGGIFDILMQFVTGKITDSPEEVAMLIKEFGNE